MRVRERPPLRLHATITTPNGRRYRWAEDEPHPANVFSGLRHSDTMPGGFESCDCVLPRKPGGSYPDLERLSTLTIYGPGGEVAWEGRLERAPKVSGDQLAISPAAVGWQAHLEDDKSAQMVYIDRDLGHWRGPSLTRRNDLLAAAFTPHEASADSDASNASGLRVSFPGPWVSPARPCAEAWYDAVGAKVARLFYSPSYGAPVNTGDAQFSLQAYVQDGDGAGSSTSQGDVFPSTTAQDWSPATARRYAVLQWLYNTTPAGVEGEEYPAFCRNVAAIGDHGMPIRSDGVTGGLWASDIVYHAVTTWAPMLQGPTLGSIQPSGFIVPHLVFLEPTTAAEIVRQATRFGLQDWAVWEGRTFYWFQRRALGRSWRARIAPAQLEETGQSVERLWESIIVQYQDVDGSTRTVGPPGSGADTESSDLKDLDPENPANRLGIVRRDLLQMGTSTAVGATEVGRRFLEESKLLDTSGRAQFVGHVQDDRGVMHPYWKVRAGDTVIFTDAADPSPRRIVKADKDYASRTCSVDLDAPPEGLQALLERLGVVLVQIGL